MALESQPQTETSSASTTAGGGRRRWIRRAVKIAATLYVVYASFMYFFQDAVLFPPLSTSGADPFPSETQRLVFDIPTGGQVEAWFTPAPGASAQTPSPLVIFFHGQLELIDYHAATVERFRKMGCAVLLPEYRGSGRSTATLDEAGLLDDAVKCYDAIVARSDVDRSRIAYVGRSLGGANAVALATQRIPRALVLEAAFANFPDLTPHYFIPSFMARFAFPTDQRLAGLDVPVLIAHGLNDWAVPISHAHRLRQAARMPTYIEYPGGHVSFVHEEPYWNDVYQFLKSVGVIDKLPA